MPRPALTARMRAALVALLAVAWVLAPATAGAAEDPLWEVGFGGGAGYSPDYPGSGNVRFRGIGAPYFIYRGDFFRVGDDAALRLVPVDQPRLEIGVSLDASFPASSEGNPAREGMPGLETLFEFGPEIVLRGPRWPQAQGEIRLDAALQFRTVFAADFEDGLTYEGLVLEPELRVRYDDPFGRDSGISATLQPIFATETLHDFFYEVAPRFATPDRPAFDATGGYLGTEATLGVSVRPIERLQLFAGGGLGLYAGSASAGSPLLEEKVTAFAFLGATVTLFRSERTVERR